MGRALPTLPRWWSRVGEGSSRCRASLGAGGHRRGSCREGRVWAEPLCGDDGEVREEGTHLDEVEVRGGLAAMDLFLSEWATRATWLCQGKRASQARREVSQPRLEAAATSTRLALLVNTLCATRSTQDGIPCIPRHRRHRSQVRLVPLPPPSSSPSSPAVPIALVRWLRLALRVTWAHGRGATLTSPIPPIQRPGLLPSRPAAHADPAHFAHSSAGSPSQVSPLSPSTACTACGPPTRPP